MSDLATSLLDASTGQSAPGSQFDVTTIDRNLRQIDQVERSWRLPTIPSSVKLDLASQFGAQPAAISSFLNGIDSDVHGDGEDAQDPGDGLVVPRPVVSYRLLDPASVVRSGSDTLRVVFDQIAQNPRPTKPSPDSVTLWKADAVDRGYLDPATPIDSRWSPEYNGVRYEMMRDDYNKALRGDRIGAIKMSTALDTLNKWTSPSGLIRAATDLDLFWDFGAIGKEASHWGDKFRALAHTKNPLDFAGKFIDAMTGPIDDVVVPAVNLFLLATGVGAAYDFGRVAIMGARAVEA